MKPIKSGSAHRWAIMAIEKFDGDHEKAIQFCETMASQDHFDEIERRQWLGAVIWVRHHKEI